MGSMGKVSRVAITCDSWTSVSIESKGLSFGTDVGHTYTGIENMWLIDYFDFWKYFWNTQGIQINMIDANIGE